MVMSTSLPITRARTSRVTMTLSPVNSPNSRMSSPLGGSVSSSDHLKMASPAETEALSMFLRKGLVSALSAISGILPAVPKPI